MSNVILLSTQREFIPQYAEGYVSQFKLTPMFVDFNSDIVGRECRKYIKALFPDFTEEDLKFFINLVIMKLTKEYLYHDGLDTETKRSNYKV